MGYEQADEHIQNGEWGDVETTYLLAGFMTPWAPYLGIPYFFMAQKDVKMKMDNLFKDNKGGLNVNVDMMTDDEKTLYISGYEKRIKEIKIDKGISLD